MPVTWGKSDEFPSVLSRVRHLLDSPRRHSPRSVSLPTRSTTPSLRNSQHHLNLSNSPARSVSASILTPEPLFSRRGEILTTQTHIEGESENRGTSAAWTAREFPGGSSTDSLGSCMFPLEFPIPPSPHTFTTPPPYRPTRDNSFYARSTKDGVAMQPPSAPSLRSFDAAIEDAVGKAIRPSNSSKSLVTGQSLYKTTPDSLRYTIDPFLDLFESDEEAEITVNIPSPQRPKEHAKKDYKLFPSDLDLPAPLRPRSTGLPLLHSLRSLSSLFRAPAQQASQKEPSLDPIKNVPVNSIAREQFCIHGKTIHDRQLRNIGGRRWRIRHALRDGRQSCWRCRLSNVSRTLQHANWFSRSSPKARVRSMSGEDQSPQVIQVPTHKGKSQIHPPFIIPHPLEAIELQRMKMSRSRRMKKTRRPPTQKHGLAKKIAVWMLTKCYCHIVGDDGGDI